MAERAAAVVGTYRSGAQCFVEVVLERHARTHGLVNDAGVWRGGRLVDLPAGDWQQVVDADLSGVLTVVQAVLPAMLEARSGRIANVTSVIGITGCLGDTAYSAAKGGVNSLTRSLAKEVARSGAAVNAVAPDRVETDMTAQLGERARARLLERIPIGRQRRADEVACAVACFMDAPLYLTWRRHSG